MEFLFGKRSDRNSGIATEKLGLMELVDML